MATIQGGIMNRKYSTALAMLLLAGVSSARADFIPWSYNWEPSATKIAADGGSSGYVSLTNEPGAAASGASNTVVTNLRTFSTSTQASPDTFSHAPFSFTLRLVDTTSQATGSLTFAGFLSGTMTASSANVHMTFTSPTTQQLSLGGNTYSVALGTYTPPGPPGASNAGSLNAVVGVTPGNTGGGHVSGGGTPEPSTLTLAALSLSCLGLAGWRKRGRGQARPVAPMA
jgi:hypothetical protein